MLLQEAVLLARATLAPGSAVDRVVGDVEELASRGWLVVSDISMRPGSE